MQGDINTDIEIAIDVNTLTLYCFLQISWYFHDISKLAIMNKQTDKNFFWTDHNVKQYISINKNTKMNPN